MSGIVNSTGARSGVIGNTTGKGTWQGTAVADEYGGTGQTTYTQGDMLYASASNTVSKLPKGTDNHVLTMNGNVPNWEAAAAGGALTKIGYGTFSNSETVELDQDLGSYRRHKLFLKIGNEFGILASNQYNLTVKIGSDYAWSGNGTAYAGSRWWSKQDATSVSCSANDDTSSFAFSSGEGTPCLTGHSIGASRITAFGYYEFTFANFVETATDDWSYLWYSGIASNHDLNNPMFTTYGAATIMNEGEISDIKISKTQTDTRIMGNWTLYGINN